MYNTTYIFYGIEISKNWSEWPSAFGDSPRNITSGNLEVDVPNIGGEPLLLKGKAVTVEGFELTFYRYPHDQEDIIGQDNLGILGFLVCEIEPFADPTEALERYQEWQQKQSSITNFDTMLQKVCRILDLNRLEPKLWTCTSNCYCC
jgi:hypothetical protein